NRMRDRESAQCSTPRAKCDPRPRQYPTRTSMENSALDEHRDRNSRMAARAVVRQTFSFTELLLVLTVVVAIIAVVGPSVYRARGQAKIARCTDNLKALGIWASMYVSNHNDQYMPAYQEGWVAKFDGMPTDKDHKPI